MVGMHTSWLRLASRGHQLFSPLPLLHGSGGGKEWLMDGMHVGQLSREGGLNFNSFSRVVLPGQHNSREGLYI